MAEYISNGVRLGLLIDRQNHQVHIYRGDREPQILDRPESVNCEPEMPGFALKMAKIW
jgi:Uma2 family endonuclease